MGFSCNVSLKALILESFVFFIMSLSEVIDEIQKLEHFRVHPCSECGSEIRSHILEIYVSCPSCKTEHKMRGFGSVGTEIQDVVDAVLEWAGTGEKIEAVLQRHKQIQKERE